MVVVILPTFVSRSHHITITIILYSYQTALAQLTIDTLEAELEENELDEMEYALRGRIKNAEDELSKMKT